MASIRKRGSSYLIVVSMGYDYNGKRIKPQQKTVHPPEELTPKQVEKWLNEQAVLFERECRHTPQPVQQLTLAKYIDLWLTDIAPGKLAKSTIRRDRQDIERILPALGHYKLTELRPEHFRNFYAELRKVIRPDTKKPLSEYTIEGVHATLCSILSDAVEGGFLSHNPAWRTYRYAGRKCEKKIADEETAQNVCESLDCPLLTYGISSKADLFARDIEITETGVSFTLNLRNLHAERVHLLLTGMFNVYNALAAASLAMILGIDKQAIREGLESVVNVPGRVEMLDTKTPYKVILDYSHSPDALENILTTVRTFTRSRLIVLFGCGGDRDHGKRPIMGEIAGRLADFSILTSDNPRTEDPNAILASIEEGIKPTGGKYVIIENRREAIRHALEMGRDGDVIILAGKGHETYQDIMGVKRPFDEKVVVQELLRELQPELESSEE